MQIGVAPGIRISLTADNEPACRGATLEEALDYAEQKVASAQGEELASLRRWIDAAQKRIEINHFDARVENEYKKEYASVEKYAKRLPDFMLEPIENLWRERIRKNLKPD